MEFTLHCHHYYNKNAGSQASPPVYLIQKIKIAEYNEDSDQSYIILYTQKLRKWASKKFQPIKSEKREGERGKKSWYIYGSKAPFWTGGIFH